MKEKLKILKAFASFPLLRNQVSNNLKAVSFCEIKSRFFNLNSYSLFQKNNETQSSESCSEKAIVSAKQEYKIDEFRSKEDKELIERLKQGDILHPYKTPTEKISKVLAADFKVQCRKFVNFTTGIKLGDLEVNFFLKEADIVIIGCGPIGLAIAYAIRTEFPTGPSIIVVDQDENAPFTSVNLGMGTLLHHSFTEIEEIQMSKYCAEFLSTFHRHSEIPGHNEFNVAYDPLGSLYLADSENADELLRKSEILKLEGITTKYLEPNALKKKFPWLKLDNVMFGSLGTMSEGLFEPAAVLMGMKAKLVNLGVTFATAKVIDFGFEEYYTRRVICELPDGSYNYIDFSHCIFAAGKESKQLIDKINSYNEFLLEINIPFEQRKRFEYCFYNPDGPGLNTPIVVNSDGTYFRREGINNLYVAGVISAPLDNNINKKEEPFRLFEEKIKPFFEKRLKNFNKLELKSGWVDVYDTNTANNIGVLGEHPCDSSIMIVAGFSHLGFLYAPAIGRAVMEKIIYNTYRTIDMTRFQLENLYLKQHIEAEERNKPKNIESEDRRLIEVY